MMTLYELTGVADWPERCNDFLVADEGGKLFAEGLKERWSRNSPDFLPKGLNPFNKGGTLPEGMWSEVLGGMAFAHKEFQRESRKNAVAGFQAAFNDFGPELVKGTVWLRDILALRYMGYRTGEADIALAAMDIMLRGIERVPGIIPFPDKAMWSELHDVYGVIIMSLIKELKEREMIRASYMCGGRLLPWEYETLFRRMDNIIEEHKNDPGPPSGELAAWRSLNERKQIVVDQLFKTLNDCNPEYRDTGIFHPDALYSYARELDVAWFYLGNCTTMQPSGKEAAQAIKDLRQGKDELWTLSNSLLNET